MLTSDGRNIPILKTATPITVKGAKTAAAIVQDLLTLARRGVARKEVIDLNRIILDYLESPEFLKLKSYHQDVKVITMLKQDLMSISGSPHHIYHLSPSYKGKSPGGRSKT